MCVHLYYLYFFLILKSKLNKYKKQPNINISIINKHNNKFISLNFLIILLTFKNINIKKYKKIKLKKRNKKKNVYKFKKINLKTISIRKNIKKSISFYEYNYYFYNLKKIYKKTWMLFKEYYYKFFFLFQKKINNEFLFNFISFFKFLFIKVINIKLNLFFFNVTTSIPNKTLTHISIIIKKQTPLIFKFYYFDELTEIFLGTFYIKNLIFLINWIKKTIETKPLTLFLPFIYYLIGIFENIIWLNKDFYKIKGFFIKLRGKFRKGGGRKKKLVYKRGVYSSTTKSLRISLKKFYIRHISGSVGFLILIAY